MIIVIHVGNGSRMGNLSQQMVFFIDLFQAFRALDAFAGQSIPFALSFAITALHGRSLTFTVRTLS